MLIKLRNMIAMHSYSRKAGAHGKTKKAERRKDKIDLKKMIRSADHNLYTLFQNV